MTFSLHNSSYRLHTLPISLDTKVDSRSCWFFLVEIVIFIIPDLICFNQTGEIHSTVISHVDRVFVRSCRFTDSKSKHFPTTYVTLEVSELFSWTSFFQVHCWNLLSFISYQLSLLLLFFIILCTMQNFLSWRQSLEKTWQLRMRISFFYLSPKNNNSNWKTAKFLFSKHNEIGQSQWPWPNRSLDILYMYNQV